MNDDRFSQELYQQIYTVEELANLLKISKKVVYEMLNTGEMMGYKVRRSWRIPGKSVYQYLQNNTLLRQGGEERQIK